ncbi:MULTISPECIES: integrase [Ramlibacter]|uniref:Integrase n=1 Tax=Ramlibacter pinisoli TaxID=2682844 RepID=A0A6N8IMF5_9BURK|nr:MULTISPECIES: integrase [Ramlibacter]MBA2960697.1 integrase [Ramlibacter sp. CGMCC 1.13660]MVQ28027.1 integrase [Ramlibacter pinisoli]
MPDGLIHFTPRSELNGHANVSAFIKLCRHAPVLNAHKQFDENIWETEKTRKGKNGVERIVFNTLEAAKGAKHLPALPEPFVSFAKAVIVYLEDKRPVVSQGPRLSALRCLEAALRENARDRRPTAVTPTVLDAAVDLARRNLSDAVAYRVAGALEAIAELMREKRFIRMNTRWVHSVPKPRETGSRIDEASLRARQEKLPSPAAIRGLAGVFLTAMGVADTLISSSATLMMCAPERINEVVRLRRNCIDEGEGRLEGKLGLRWSGSKGAADIVKPIPTKMADIAREAISRLETCSRAAHEIAAWYVHNPRKIYLAKDVEHLRAKKLLTTAEVSQILWGPAGGAAVQWCNKEGIELIKDGRTARVRFSDVERAVLSMLPRSFPYLPGDGPPIRVDEALCVMRKNELHPGRATYECMFDVLEQSDIGSRLGQRNDSGIPSIFAKYGFTEDDGSPIVVNSHAFRHYLETLAEMGGLTDVQIAAFSGRVDVRQNSAYDHMTSDQAQAPIHRATKEHGFMSGLVKAPSRTLINRADFVKLDIGATHTTDYGFCRHDFAAEPCQMHRDCLNCDEEVCVKGEVHKLAALRLRVAETKRALSVAKKALTDHEFGADRWVAHQQKTLMRAEELLALLTNPDTPDGTVITLAAEDQPMPIGHVAPSATTRISSAHQRALK